MAGLLDIPGYGGFLQQGQLNDQQAQRRLQGVLGALQVAQGIEGMQDAPLKRQMLQAQVQGVLAQQKQQEEVNKLLDSLPPEQRALARIAPHQYVTGLLQERAKAQAAQAAQQGVLTMAERPGAAVMAPTNDVEAPAPVVNMRGTPGVLSSLFSNESPEIAGMARTGNELMLKGGFADVKDANAYVQKVMEMNASQAQARRAQQENIADRQFRQQEGFAQQDAMRRMIDAGRQPPQPPAPHFYTDDAGNLMMADRSGRSSPVLTPTGEQAKARPPLGVATRSDKMRGEFEKETKPIKEFTVGYNTVAPIMQRGGELTSSEGRALVTAFIKAQDPNDRISEGDWARVDRLMNVPERIAKAIASVAKGDVIQPRVAQEMWSIINAKKEALSNQAAQLEDRYYDMATRNKLNPDDVVRPLSGKGTPAERARIRELRAKANGTN